MRKSIKVDSPAYNLELNPSQHSEAHPFCYDLTCKDCHEDPDFIGNLGDQVRDGLLTPQEADNIYHRRNI